MVPLTRASATLVLCNVFPTRTIPLLSFNSTMLTGVTDEIRSPKASDDTSYFLGNERTASGRPETRFRFRSSMTQDAGINNAEANWWHHRSDL
jgi:hypothetical protein